MAVSFSVFLDKRRIIRKRLSYPIKLRVIHDRVPKEYQTVHNLDEAAYQKLGASHLSADLLKVKNDLKEIKSTVGEAIRKIDPFDFWVFKRDIIIGNPLFVQKKAKQCIKTVSASGADKFDYSEYYKVFPILTEKHDEIGTISGVYCEYIKKLIREKRIGSAIKYLNSYNVLVKYGGNMHFRDITEDWLRSFETYMIDKGRSRATVGGLLRALRAIFNLADAKKIINKQMCYPFGRHKYLIPVAKRRKKYLELSDIRRIYFNESSCEAEEYAKALWFFLYFGNGMNPKDLTHLKFKDIEGDYFSFYRLKTDFTSRHNPILITVYINDDMHETIERYGNRDRAPDNYVFPFLTKGAKPLEEYFATPRVTQFINDWMKKIGERLNIELKPTTIITRHSFSTVMKRAGASTEFIQEALGHADKRTTEIYLGGFEQEVKKKFAQKLEAFKSHEELIEDDGRKRSEVLEGNKKTTLSLPDGQS